MERMENEMETGIFKGSKGLSELQSVLGLPGGH